jgi:hypothetical protein
VYTYENDNIYSFLEKRFGNKFVIVDFYDDDITNLTRTPEEFFKFID